MKIKLNNNYKIIPNLVIYKHFNEFATINI